MGKIVSHSPRLSANRVERLLAVLLVGLLGLYALGTLVSNSIPVLDTAGVIAIHFALVVAGVFPVAVLGHALYSSVRTGTAKPRHIEILSALIALSCSGTALLLTIDSPSSLSTPLFAIATGALLVLAGLVAVRS
ncbi:hypothetical protein SAMN04487946_11124 [Halobellus clavatus]|uniref:Uncharacterized protein n=1 Tax=Halobellus clavatus TaxID=660517 RepID=A0A1H3IVM9_9EURY|nr:hypothetical protein SAMN04487946_11124 [Halobellus clavatus]